ncbi:MAG: phage tail protein [Bacillota bacterium]|nr:phage tail protein [Bacillota bacterium]
MARRKGLKDIYVAKVTKNDANSYTTSDPVKLCKAISAKVTPKVNSDKLYSDDSVEDIINNFDSCDVEIEGNELSPEMRALLFGHTVTKGMEIDNINDFSNEVAFGYRAKKTDGKYEFVWLYCGKFEDVADDNETTADKVKTQTAKIKGSFYGRAKDGNYRVRVDESFLADTDEEAKTAISNWFENVQEPVAA